MLDQVLGYRREALEQQLHRLRLLRHACTRRRHSSTSHRGRLQHCHCMVTGSLQAKELPRGSESESALRFDDGLGQGQG